jgi:hypothetical protein
MKKSRSIFLLTCCLIALGVSAQNWSMEDYERSGVRVKGEELTFYLFETIGWKATRDTTLAGTDIVLRQVKKGAKNEIRVRGFKGSFTTKRLFPLRSVQGERHLEEPIPTYNQFFEVQADRVMDGDKYLYRAVLRSDRERCGFIVEMYTGKELATEAEMSAFGHTIASLRYTLPVRMEDHEDMDPGPPVPEP